MTTREGTAVKGIAEVVYSKRDRSGNCYYYLIYTDVATGIQVEGVVDTVSNTRSLYMAFGWDIKTIYCTEREISVRQYEARVKNMPYLGCSAEDMCARIKEALKAKGVVV